MAMAGPSAGRVPASLPDDMVSMSRMAWGSGDSMDERLSAQKAAETLRGAAEAVSDGTRSLSARVVEQAVEAKDVVESAVTKLRAEKHDPYEEATAEYNGAFTEMNDYGVSLLRQRERSVDLLELVELLINSVANTPKSFAKDFQEIDLHKAHFTDVLDFARRDLAAVRASAAGAGAGFAAGAAVASMAPTAAMWAATTFGVASTGTAISTLSGAAATNAALAWLGGGALAAGGGGTAAGTALLALAGPIGWTVAGATLLVSIVLYTRGRFKNRAAKQEALAAVKQNTAIVRGVAAEIEALVYHTNSLREHLMKLYSDALQLFGADFLALSRTQQVQLGQLVNCAKAAAALLSRTVGQDATDE